MKALLTTLLLSVVLSSFAQTNVPATNAAAIKRAAANDPLQPIRSGIKIREDRLAELQRKMREYDTLISEQTQLLNLANAASNKSAQQRSRQKIEGYRAERQKVAQQAAQLKLEIGDLRTRYKIPEPAPVKKTPAKK